MCLRAGRMALPSRPSLISSHRRQRRARGSSRWQTESRRSTTTGRCGLSSPCRRSLTSCFVSGPRRSKGPVACRPAALQGNRGERLGVLRGSCDPRPKCGGAAPSGVCSLVGGNRAEEFDAQAREWLKTVKQPKLGVLYVDIPGLLSRHPGLRDPQQRRIALDHGRSSDRPSTPIVLEAPAADIVGCRLVVQTVDFAPRCSS